MKNKMTRKDRAALKIQKVVRGFFARKMYKRQRNAIMKMQANVLARQTRRAYLEMLGNTLTAQAYIKRFLAMLWYKRIKESKDSLENHIENINEMISKFNVNANQFKE